MDYDDVTRRLREQARRIDQLTDSMPVRAVPRASQDSLLERLAMLEERVTTLEADARRSGSELVHLLAQLGRRVAALEDR
jgi:hypothetical protein